MLAEARRLRAELAERDRTIEALRAREHSYQLLMEQGERRYVAEIAYDEASAAPHIKPAAREEELGELTALLSTERSGAEQRRALETGDAVRYEETRAGHGGEETWHVMLAPVPGSAQGDGGRLLASVRNVTEARQVKAALHETERLYHHLIEMLPDAITIVGARERLRYVNSAGVRLLGASEAGALLGRSVWDFVHPDDRARMRARTDALRQGQPVDFDEYQLVRLDGETFPVETASVPIQYQGEPAVLTAARDLRSRRAMANALSETLGLFYSIFQLGPVAFAISRLSDETFLEVNRQFLRLTGYTREEVIGRSRSDLNLWVEAEEQAAFVRKLRKETFVHDLEARIRRKSGEERIFLVSSQGVEVRGEPCALTVALDITERKRAAAAERESRDLFRKMFHASPTPISITRLSDSRFIDVNEALGRMVGYTPEEMIGRPAPEFNLWARPEQRAELLERVRREGFVHDAEVEVRTRSGQALTVLTSFQRIRVGGEECLLAVLTDITARKQAEQALLEAKERAEEMARFRTGLLTNMTHEVRTPLTVILGFTSMLREGVREEYRRFVDLVERSGHRLLLTLDSVLDLAQLQAGTLEVERQPYNVLDMVYGAAEAYRPLAEKKGLAFSIETTKQNVYARIDHELVSRVLNHLLDNAVKFTEAGSVTVRTRVKDDEVLISVSDTGVGIEEEFLPYLFDAFSQESTGLERTYQGSGLGLAVSKQLVERTGGRLQVKSRKGRGSTFTIALPGETSAGATT